MLNESPSADPSTWCLCAAGEMDMATADALVQRLRQLLLVADTVLLDLSAVTFFDATGVSALITGRAEAQAHGATLAITGASPVVRRVLGLVNLTELLHEPAVQPDSHPRTAATSTSQADG